MSVHDDTCAVWIEVWGSYEPYQPTAAAGVAAASHNQTVANAATSP